MFNFHMMIFLIYFPIITDAYDCVSRVAAHSESVAKLWWLCSEQKSLGNRSRGKFSSEVV